jgi:hypothetical protein
LAEPDLLNSAYLTHSPFRKRTVKHRKDDVKILQGISKAVNMVSGDVIELVTEDDLSPSSTPGGQDTYATLIDFVLKDNLLTWCIAYFDKNYSKAEEFIVK